MKARVKATGEIVEVKECASYYKERGWYFVSIVTGLLYKCEELVFDVNNECPDYWDRLLHQYAGMAMQGLCANSGWDDCTWETMAEDAISASHALIQKLKEKEERK